MFEEALGGGVTKRIDEVVLVAAEIGVHCPAGDPGATSPVSETGEPKTGDPLPGLAAALDFPASKAGEAPP